MTIVDRKKGVGIGGIFIESKGSSVCVFHGWG